MLLIKKTLNYITEDIWKIRTQKLSKTKSFLIKQLRIILLAFRGFNEDKCSLQASAMTYFSALSLVPVIALIFAIAKGFGFEQGLEKRLIESFEGQQEVLNWVMQFAHSMLESTKGGMIAGIGIILLFWSVMKLLGNIERSFNDIWGIKKSRVFIRKFTDYISIFIIAPIFIILSSSTTVFISTFIDQPSVELALFNYATPFLAFLVKFIPYLLIILLLTFVYTVMPNTKVKLKSALFAGVVAGISFQMLQWGYVNFQVGVSRYNAIYGSFAALPLFLVWLQLSWTIVLFGGELSFAAQNVGKYEHEVGPDEISYSKRRTLLLLISTLVIKNFHQGKSPYSAIDLSDQLEIPRRLVNNLIYQLVESGLFAEINTDLENVYVYQPAEDINKLNMSYVINKLENWGTADCVAETSEELEHISTIFHDFNATIRQSAQNILLKDI
ncbi:MAG: YihY/virulence factor BrkB family protein [Bacteroidales bacterium]|jgi:membrane protein|nr:YihY/virulence factor BrkB family protein [Bacteroidales bacterium]